MPLRRTELVKPDGRRIWHYGSVPSAPAAAAGPQVSSEGLELRWHPILEEWVIVAPERQDRTFLPPAEYCPLCPTRDGSLPTEVPWPDYEIAVFENRFPSFVRDAPAPDAQRGPYRSERAIGACEVVLYAAEHDATLAGQPLERVERLVDVWADRYRELGARSEVAYVFIFENRGPEIGVTLTHPHGQIYAFPFVPPRAQRELDAQARYRRRNGRCLGCDVVAAELREGRRIVARNDAFAAYVPYFARLPYEVHLSSVAHRPSIAQLTASERRALAAVLKTVLMKYDNLWGRQLPFVMAMHQRPTDGRRYPGCHFRIEFSPPNRSVDRLKYLAGVETGAGTYINDARAEQTSAELRAAEPQT